MAITETLIPMPGRLHTLAVNGHLAGADEIYDDTLSKTQATINSEVAYLDVDEGTAVVPEFDPESDTVWNKAQVLSDTQKAQVKTNLGLSTVATTGSYTDLSNKPTIPVVPTNVSAFINDAGYLTNTNAYTKTQVDTKTESLEEGVEDANGLAMCMSLAHLSAVGTTTQTTNVEWKYVLLDYNDKVLCGIKQDGKSYVYASIAEIMDCINSSYT